MKQPNAYKMVDQTTKQTIAFKTPLCIKSHIQIKNMHHTYNNPILCLSRLVIQSLYNKAHLHSSAASLSVLDHPAPQFHGKIQSCYPPVRYIQLVPP